MKTIRINDLEDPVPTAAAQRLIDDLEAVDIKLDGASLLRIAETELDVPLDIDDDFLDRIEFVIDDILANSQIHSLGLFSLQRMAVEGIVHTSRMNYLRRKDPEISEMPVSRPLVVAGMARSGTTFLLQLIEAEPSLIGLKRWETLTPFPSKKMLLEGTIDTRRDQAAEKFAVTEAILPHFRAMYNAGIDDSTEEIALLGKGCYGLYMSFFGNAPKLDKAFYENSQVEAYRYLYDQLQTLQWLKPVQPDQRYLLKTPQHLGALDALDTVFPDATVIFTHRDPASTFTSLLTLLGYTARLTCSHISREQIIARTRRMQHGFLKGLVKHADAFRDKAMHVYFDKFMSSYQETMAQIFEHAGIPFDTALRGRVVEQADRFKRGSGGGRLVYDLENDFGLTRDGLRGEFSYYLDKFPVAIEGKHS